MNKFHWCDTYFSNTPDYIGLVDPNGIITYVNPSFAIGLDVSADKLIGTHIKSILKESEESWDLLSKHAIKSGSPLNVSLNFKRTRGSAIQVEGHICPWMEGDSCNGIILCLHDITITKHQINEERNKIALLLNILRHDLTSIHQEVLTAIELAISEEGLSQHTKNLLVDSLNEINRGEQVIQNIIKLIKLEQEDIKPVSVDISVLLAKALDDVRSNFGDDSIERCDLPPSPIFVQGSHQLIDVFRAIFTTAVILNQPKKPSITIEVQNQDYVIITFSILGIGFTKADMKNLLVEPVVGINRTMGRLLSLTKLIVQKFGGSFDMENLIEDNSLQGVKFTLRLLKGQEADIQGGGSNNC